MGEAKSLVEWALSRLVKRLTSPNHGPRSVFEMRGKQQAERQRLSEKFWRTFVQKLHEDMSKTTSSEEMLPELDVFEAQLAEARMPKCSMVNSAVSPIDLYIGSAEIDPSQAIRIPIKYSKATMKARPPSLSKAWKAAMDLQTPLAAKGSGQPSSSQLMSSLAAQSQTRGGPSASDLAAMISAEVKSHSTYVIKKTEPAKPTNGVTEVPASQVDYGDAGLEEYYTQRHEDVPEEEEEEVVDKEDIVKAWRFGSTWVPMEKDTFEPLETSKGVEVLGFFPQENVSVILMGLTIRSNGIISWVKSGTSGQIQHHPPHK